MNICWQGNYTVSDSKLPTFRFSSQIHLFKYTKLDLAEFKFKVENFEFTLGAFLNPVSEFNEFKACLKSPKKWFQFSAGLTIEKFHTILSGTSPGLNLRRGSNSLNSASGYPL